MPFLFIFVLIPIAEVYAFINVGDEIGVLKTLLLCVATALIGGLIVRYQGLETLMKAKSSLRSGGIPLDAFFDGICIVIAGALLLTPGFVTDTFGFCLLIPPLRHGLKNMLIKSGKFNMAGNNQENSSFTRPNTSNDDIIEGNYEKVDENNPKIDK